MPSIPESVILNIASIVLMSMSMPICLKAVSIYVLDIAPEPSLSTISKARLMEILEDFIALKNK